MTQKVEILQGDCLDVLRTLPDASVHCCVTSPPYWGLRDYGNAAQLGLESTPEEYVAKMVEVFREVRRVLRDDGTCWLNLGDSYNTAGTRQGNGKGGIHGNGDGTVYRAGYRGEVSGLKTKDLVGIPWRIAFALQADGWWLRQDIIWHKPNPMPESVRDRCTKAHEYVFLLTKSERYYMDMEPIREPIKESNNGSVRSPKLGPDRMTNSREMNEVQYAEIKGANRRSVWTISTKPYSGAHFAVMPPDLVEPCVLAGTSDRGCCPACGKPWERVVEREKDGTRQAGNARAVAMGHSGHGPTACMRAGEPMTSRTTGWRPACTCGGSPVPCTVLDPFAGSGTVAAVALSLGRSSIGIELNPQYVELAQERIAKTISSQPLLYDVSDSVDHRNRQSMENLSNQEFLFTQSIK